MLSVLEHVINDESVPRVWLQGLLVAAVLVEQIGRIRSMAYPSIVCGMCMLLLMLGPGDLIETGGISFLHA